MELQSLSPSQLVDHYKIYTIRQKNKERVIQAPDEELKSLQRNTIGFFAGFQSFYPGCMARAGLSVLNNAAPHHGSAVLFKADIKSFYPSVTLQHLLRNFNLDGRPEWISEARKKILMCLLPVNGQLVLPTGAPTSPVLCNIAATDLDLELATLAEEHEFLYTRYIDDLTFSSKIKGRCQNFQVKVLSSIREHGFTPHPIKTGWFFPNSHIPYEVTGVALDGDKNKSRLLKNLRRTCRVRLDKIAAKGIQIDKVTQGYLAYMKMLDPGTYSKFMVYLEKRKVRYGSSK